jgi:NADH dehydrogenase
LKGGPDVYTYRELVELVLRRCGSSRVLLPVSFPVWALLAGILSVLPTPPLTRDQVVLMRRDNVVARDALTLGDLGVVPSSVEAVLPSIFGSARKD